MTLPAARPFAATVIAGLVLLVGVTGCRDATSPLSLIADAQARELWEKRGPASYSFEFEVGCFCRGELIEPVTITVVDDVVVSRTYTNGGGAVAAEFAGWFPSVDGIFAMIADLRHERLERLVVEYDRMYGHPVKILVDHCADCLDDGASYVVRNFQPHE